MRRRVVPPIEELRAELAEAGVVGPPTDAPDPHALQGLLDLGAHLAGVKKRISFEGLAWSDPGFVAKDARIDMRIVYAELVTDVETTLLANLPRLAGGRALLAIDARRSQAREFDLGHALYGEPTLFRWPSKPPEAADPRIDAAREAGWTRVLKEHNLLPGRGIVVLDEHQGLFLRDERFAGVLGLLLLLENGHIALWWNPFARDADPELQYWLAWGTGTGPASAWREQLYVEEE